MTVEEKRRGPLAVIVALLVGFLSAHRDVLLDAIGAALVVAGIALWSIPAALIVAGVAVLVAAHPIPVGRAR